MLRLDPLMFIGDDILPRPPMDILFMGKPSAAPMPRPGPRDPIDPIPERPIVAPILVPIETPMDPPMPAPIPMPAPRLELIDMLFMVPGFMEPSMLEDMPELRELPPPGLMDTPAPEPMAM